MRSVSMIVSIVLCLILDSRQNLPLYDEETGDIVLCLILDSRQNSHAIDVQCVLIVLCLILDSRQNGDGQQPCG